VRAVVRCARASGVAASRERRVAKKNKRLVETAATPAEGVSRKKEAEMMMIGVSVVFFCERSRQT
jgi:hypothetical protein